MEAKKLTEYTLEEFQAMENFYHGEVFTDVIIVPTDDIHESGYRCMKFVLANQGKICGVVGGWSDVVYPNGVGNYGHRFLKDIPHMGLSIDCLTKSKCLRLMMSHPCELGIGPICSSFEFYCVYTHNER